MPSKPIQEQFGQHMIESFASFARADLKTSAQLEQDEFSHVADATLRRALAQVLYGVRWIYKLGLALLTSNEERAAHIRAQIVDYASVCEGLLSYCVAHAIRGGHTAGTRWQADEQNKAITWNVQAPERQLKKRSLWWLIRIAQDFGIVNHATGGELEWLREERNTVHLRQRAAVAHASFIRDSRRAFRVVLRTIDLSKLWAAAHP